ncbi:glycoside hydrolase family 2 protein [Pseudonocardia kunmingensis]|uniref:glycoside hydrolase family 2 protein n=1 Tax=Pseudonocardia kunmingensis TaxID=630975 RepID=UPI001153207C|nr:sugar-binding domain-containing protein [Pseudonocardia kunmingensis]
MNGENVHEDYPRPQLVRPEWQDLCGEWSFAFDDADAGRGAGWATAQEPFDRTIMVPYPYESELSGIGDPSPRPVVWYRREVEIAPPGPGQRVLLHFGAVDHTAQVWVNGVHLGGHEGGHTPFSFDVTDALVPGSTQVVVVRAEDHADDVTQPRGKQDWLDEPHGIFYKRTTGIWQPVWAEVVPDLHVAELHWTPDVPGAAVTCEVALSRRPDRPVRLRVRLCLGEEELAEHTVRIRDAHSRFAISIPAARHDMHHGRLLWSPERPTLVDADVEVLDEGGAAFDRVGSYFGFRSAGVQDGRFVLNGQPTFLRLALEQGYWPQSHLAAPDAAALRREAELVKELGFNGIRIHQKVEDPRFLAWCDRIGLLVWDEMPSAFEFAPRTVERTVREWMEVVRRDRSHPCVVTWVPMNESWGVWHLAEVAEQRHLPTALYHLTKSLDGSRPVISNDGWEITETDIWGVHDYAPHGESLRERYDGPDAVARVLDDRRPGRKKVVLGDPVVRGLPVVLTEFGGLSYAPAAGEKWFGYGTVGSAEELTERLRGLVDAVLDNPELAGFCYTQLTDTEQERNGLLTEDRAPKLPVAVIREILTRPSAAVPPEAVEANRRAARGTAG